jgi:hypothetical protein
MFGTWFYNKRVRTAVSVFGSLFNNLYVLRQNASGQTISTAKVPLSYAPRRDFIERLEAMQRGEEAERRVAVKLPRMSFEITNMRYDSLRQLPKVNSFYENVAGDDYKRKRVYTSVPYDIDFQLSVFAKTQDDALQIVEQIIPYFNPQYSITVKPFADEMDIKEDVPIVLTGITFQDTYDGPLETRRTIVYDLTFTMKLSFYGPEKTQSIIREVNNNLYLMGADSDTFIHNINITPDPIDVSPDSDYGFNVQYLDSAG